MQSKDPVRQMAKRGVSDFEDIEKIRRLQASMLKLLKHSSVDPDRYAGLANCCSDYCGRVNCLEACLFGAYNRRLIDVPSALRLLQNAGPPFYEVRLSRALWSRPFGKLRESSIAAAKQLNRRALDNLYNRRMVVSVGSFKVAPSSLYDTERWICEIHQVVAGAVREELERTLSTRQSRGERRSKLFQPFVDYLMVKEIPSAGQMVNRVLRCDLSGWRHPWRQEIPPERPTKARRKEFCAWLLELDPGARLICYGCDRHFNKLAKQPLRPPPPKAPRKRPSPPEAYYFGSETRYRMGLDDSRGRGRKSPPRMHRRLQKYFEK